MKFPKLNYANVVSTICLFLLLGGSAAFAATQLPKNSVGSKQLKKGSVGPKQLKKDAVTGAKVKAGSIAASDLQAGVIPTVPKPPDPINAYTKAESDGRYLRGTVVVSATIANEIAADGFQTGTVSCPAGHQAIAGGVDVDGVFSGKVSASSPLIEGKRPEGLPPGQYGPATGWWGAVTVQGGPTPVHDARVVVVCAAFG